MRLLPAHLIGLPLLDTWMYEGTPSTWTTRTTDPPRHFSPGRNCIDLREQPVPAAPGAWLLPVDGLGAQLLVPFRPGIPSSPCSLLQQRDAP